MADSLLIRLLIAPFEGLTMSFPLNLRKVHPRKSKPVSMCVIKVFPSESCSPRIVRKILNEKFQFFRYFLRVCSDYKVSRPREPPPKSLSEPYVNLSAHTAPIIQPLAVFRISSVQTGSFHA